MGFHYSFPHMSPSPAFYEALIEALVAGAPSELVPEAQHRAVQSSAQFAGEQVDALTAELRWPLKIGLAGFRTLVWLMHRRSFAALPLDRRRRILEAWAFGPIALTRQLFRPIRTTALVAYYEAVAQGAAPR
jgi:hypothetical protein